jgi:hypothetical protein
LKFSKAGILKEYPDLKDNEQWQQIAIERFRDKIKQMDTEKTIMDYVIEDLKKHGYTPLKKMEMGHRSLPIK